mmetsp:Transcript_16056/g.31449  ORF Transcript_16056/g.31449 Transcript_16056/m.31449 type:complete len:208 (+) Transcript_16056:776-1399(+)
MAQERQETAKSAEKRGETVGDSERELGRASQCARAHRPPRQAPAVELYGAVEMVCLFCCVAVLSLSGCVSVGVFYRPLLEQQVWAVLLFLYEPRYTVQPYGRAVQSSECRVPARFRGVRCAVLSHLLRYCQRAGPVWAAASVGSASPDSEERDLTPRDLGQWVGADAGGLEFQPSAAECVSLLHDLRTPDLLTGQQHSGHGLQPGRA